MGLDGVEHHAAQAAGVTAVERHRVDVVADRYTTLDDENHRGRVHSLMRMMYQYQFRHGDEDIMSVE